MSSFLANSSTNHKVHLAATAAISVIVGAAAVLTAQRLQREARLSKLKRSIPAPAADDADVPSPSIRAPIPDDADVELARRAQAGDFDEELVQESLARNLAFVGAPGLARLREAFVVVVGCGGVGSHCAATLARSGVGALRLVDFDQVTLSSLNRHAVAGLADVGASKVQCLRRRLAGVTPWVRFDLRPEKFDEQSAARLLGPWNGGEMSAAGAQGPDWGRQPDFVVDAIDNIDTKVALLKYCHDHNLPVISSMGAGCKSDPTKIVVGDIGTSTDDGLSRATRRRLKLLGVTRGIPVVFSKEKMGAGKAALLPLPEEEFQKGAVGDLGVLPDFRVRILPVLGTMPAVFGLTAANHIILQITGYPIDYVPFKGRDKMYESVLAALQSSEEKIVRGTEGGPPELGLGIRIPITAGDVAFLVDELYRGRSAISRLPNRLVLIRWRRAKGSILIKVGEQKSTNIGLGNLVCMTKEEAVRHQKEVLEGEKSPEDLYDLTTVKRIESLLTHAADYESYR